MLDPRSCCCARVFSLHSRGYLLAAGRPFIPGNLGSSLLQILLVLSGYLLDGNAPSPRRQLPWARPEHTPALTAPCVGSGPLGPTWALAVLSRPPRKPASTSGFTLGGHTPSLLGGAWVWWSFSSKFCRPFFPGEGSSHRVPLPAYWPPSHGSLSLSYLPPLWQDSCCATWTVERSASQVFIQVPPPKLPPSSPSERTFDAGPLRFSLTSPSGSP